MTALALVAPMEAKLVPVLPTEPGWQFEPKWDGFRCIAYRDGDTVDLQSKSGKPLARYFPEVVELMRALDGERFVLDGELLIPIDDTLSFDALQARLHPAASRVTRLSRETPALFMAFDCLVHGEHVLADKALSSRRVALEAFAARQTRADFMLSPSTIRLQDAEDWLARSGGALDGVVAKRLTDPYRAGERAMLKVKKVRTADCIVAGFRDASGSSAIGSLLLGLYDEAGLVNHVGFTSAIKADEQAALRERLSPYIGGTGFTGKAPGGPSRWSTERSSQWTSLAPELVVEVSFDQVTAARFRHGTSIVRWRPDKLATQCTMDQLAYALKPAELGL